MYRLLLLTLLIPLSSQIAINSTSDGWNLVWSDEFDGDSLDLDSWDFEEGCNGWGNDELECYTVNRHENARVENGHLTINVKVEPWADKQYTSARLISKHWEDKKWTFGKFEARAKMPKGKHLWPAIWMMPADEVYGGWAASGEIDIMEYRGQRPHTIEGTIHYGGEWPNIESRGSEEMKYPFDFSSDYHTFALEWEWNEIRWLLDGKVYHKENINRDMWSKRGRNPYTKKIQPFDEAFYWILNIAVGGNFFPEDEYGQLTVEEARRWEKPTMEIDYVRVYQREE